MKGVASLFFFPNFCVNLFSLSKPFKETSEDIRLRLRLRLLLPPPHPNIKAQRFAQEALARLEGFLVGFELVAAEDGRDDEGEFHLQGKKKKKSV